MAKNYVVDVTAKTAILKDLTAEEEAQAVIDEENTNTERQAALDAEAEKATNKANAKAKLIAGEALTEAEADTIVL